MVGPPALFLGVFLLVPLILMGVMSVRPDMRGGPFEWGWSPTLEQYRTAGSFLPLLWTSVRVAFVVAITTTVLAYPVAYFLAFRVRHRAAVLLTLLILPFWTSYLLRIISWKIILGTDGVVNSFLEYAGLVQDPVSLLLYSRTAVIVTLVYLWLPFAALPIYASLLRIDRSLLEAAADLGGSPRVAFWRVTFPLSLPGVMAAGLMVFIPTVGEYIAPMLVGGTKGTLFGNIIELFFGDGLNWPLGSALALIMLVGVVAAVIAVARLARVGKLLEEL